MYCTDVSNFRKGDTFEILQKAETSNKWASCLTWSFRLLIIYTEILLKKGVTHLFGVHIVQMVLNKLDCGVEVSLVELVRDVPS